jgi:hypothetical protein
MLSYSRSHRHCCVLKGCFKDYKDPNWREAAVPIPPYPAQLIVLPAELNEILQLSDVQNRKLIFLPTVDWQWPGGMMTVICGAILLLMGGSWQPRRVCEHPSFPPVCRSGAVITFPPRPRQLGASRQPGLLLPSDPSTHSVHTATLPGVFIAERQKDGAPGCSVSAIFSKWLAAVFLSHP